MMQGSGAILGYAIGFAFGTSLLWFFVAALVFKKRIKPKIKLWMVLAGFPIVVIMHAIILLVQFLFINPNDTSSSLGILLNSILNPAILPLMISIFYWYVVELKFSENLD